MYEEQEKFAVNPAVYRYGYYFTRISIRDTDLSLARVRYHPVEMVDANHPDGQCRVIRIIPENELAQRA